MHDVKQLAEVVIAAVKEFVAAKEAQTTFAVQELQRENRELAQRVAELTDRTAILEMRLAAVAEQ